MRIDDFVNTYTSIELEKINERKAIRSKPKRKALMGKILESIGKAYLVGEKCQSKDVSPDKAVKILYEAFSSQGNFAKCIAVPKKGGPKFLRRSKTFKESP